MKKLIALTFAFIGILMLVGCEESTAPETPTVTYTVVNGGGGLNLSWGADANVDGFIIYHDGVAVDTVTDATTYTDTVPCMVIEVTAYAGDLESDPAEIDCKPIETPSLTVYGNTDPDTTHPSGFGFNAGGTAVAYSLSNSSNHPLLDYYINSTVSPADFVSPSDHVPPYNAEVNATKNSGSTNYQTVKVADPAGGYSTQTDITANAVYYFWIDPTNNGWDSSTDYFGKIQVTGVNGLAYTLKIAYQKISGLRWCVTP